MATGTYKYQSDIARHYVHQGRQEGLEQGRTEGEARGEARGEANSILTVLATRGFKVPAAVRKRIQGCTDTSQLTTWLERAVTAQRAEDLFD